MLDVVFNVGDVLTFALVVFITLPSNDHFHNLLPVCYIFLVIALLSSLLTVFQAASLLVRILVQKKGDAGAYVAARAKQVAKRASFRAMTEGRDVQREHIDEALHALRRSDVGHMDEVGVARGAWGAWGGCQVPCMGMHHLGTHSANGATSLAHCLTSRLLTSPLLTSLPLASRLPHLPPPPLPGPRSSTWSAS